MIDLSGQIFGRLTVIQSDGMTSYSNKKWLCRCECGKEIIVFQGNLRRGSSKSCGCLARDLRRSSGHGHSNFGQTSRTYKSWAMMIQRCTNKNRDNYKYYGGRGIKICKRWGEFIKFLEDMGDRPEGKTLDRIDNDKDYTPKNCKWSTQKEQCNNRRPKKVEL